MPETIRRTCLCVLTALTLLLTQADRLCAEPSACQRLIFIALPWQLEIRDGIPEQITMRATSLCNSRINTLSGMGPCRPFGKQVTMHVYSTDRSRPLHPRLLLQPPLWLTINSMHNASASDWHTPLLTPAVARAGKLLRQRQIRRAQRMADRAFYFGIDADNDALK